MEKHEYFCPGCGGISPKAKDCETPGCKLEGRPLKKRAKK